jgi:hypothetical protein
MLLHELYFDSLGGAGAAMTPAMALALSASFGSPQRWRDEFVAMGKALAGISRPSNRRAMRSAPGPTRSTARSCSTSGARPSSSSPRR